MPNDDLLHQMLVMIVIIGVASGGLYTLQASSTIGCLFLSFIILPMNVWLFYQDTWTHFSLGVALFTYFCFMIMVSLRGHKLLLYNMTLRYKNVAKKILALIQKPMQIKHHTLLITGSIGVSLYPDDGLDLSELMKHADKALYLVKSEGRNNYKNFMHEQR